MPPSTNNNKQPTNIRFNEHDELVKLRNVTTTPRPGVVVGGGSLLSTQQRPNVSRPLHNTTTPFTTSPTTTTRTTTSPPRAPLLYKLNINDTYSKSLLDNIKSKDNRLNIVIKKPPLIDPTAKLGSGPHTKLGQLVVDTNINNNNNNINFNSIPSVKNKVGVTTPFPFNQLNPVILSKQDKPVHPQITTR